MNRPAVDSPSNDFVSLEEKPSEARLVNQIVGRFLVGEEAKGVAARGRDHFEGFLDWQVRLAEDIHNEIDDDLQPAESCGFPRGFLLASPCSTPVAPEPSGQSLSAPLLVIIRHRSAPMNRGVTPVMPIGMTLFQIPRTGLEEGVQAWRASASSRALAS